MSKNIDITEVGNAIVQVLGEYNLNVREGLNQTTKEYGKELLRETKSKAPVKTGRYKRHMAVRNEKVLLGDLKATVHVRSPHYRLAHLLEKGHALPQGGRAKAQPHFKPALDFVEPRYVREIKRIIERGGL